MPKLSDWKWSGKLDHIWVTDYGRYRFTTEEIERFGGAKLRKDRWWDLRYKKGREAADYFFTHVATRDAGA